MFPSVGQSYQEQLIALFVSFIPVAILITLVVGAYIEGIRRRYRAPSEKRDERASSHHRSRFGGEIRNLDGKNSRRPTDLENNLKKTCR